jgi:hypothetical protein
VRALALAVLLVATACGGQPPSHTPSLSPEPPSTPVPSAIAREAAIEIARSELPTYMADEGVLSADRGPFRLFGSAEAASRTGERPAADSCVWRIDFGHVNAPLMGQGMVVILDCMTGVVVQAYEWIT